LSSIEKLLHFDFALSSREISGLEGAELESVFVRNREKESFGYHRIRAEAGDTHAPAKLWYICAMLLKHLVFVASLLATTQGTVQAQTATGGQSASQTVEIAQAAPAANSQATASGPTQTLQTAGSAAVKPDCQQGPCDYQMPHITVATPAPAPSPWPVQDRILWGANILLALLGYAGIVLAVSTLKKIERQTKYGETAALAAQEAAEAALIQAKAIVQAERPWILIHVVPSPTVENGFTVIATNRGRGPARVLSTAAELRIAKDETQLPGIPVFAPVDPDVPPVSMILLPGEFAPIKAFCREDVKAVSGTEDVLRRIENWEERIFLYGKVMYKDLMAPPDGAPHETSWCCRYIHGRQKSGLVMAGTQEYNQHT
jgi:hypothetical protein